MYRLKRIWLKLRSHAGMYIFAWLQFVVILYILSIEIGILRYNYDETHFIEEYDEDMYLYANVMDTIINKATDGVWVQELIGQFIQEVQEINGVKGLGYNIALWCLELIDGNGEERIFYLNDVMAGITYKNVSGSWLPEAEYSEKYVNVVVGSELGKKYGIGDTFTVEGVSPDCKVVGILGESAGIVDLNIGGSSKELQQSYDTGWCVYTDDERILENSDISEYGYPSMSFLLLLEEEYDEEELLKYGNVYSLKYMENCSEDYFATCVNIVFTDYGVLLFVVLFGAFATAYLIISKGMYTSGVYSLLGMTRLRIAVENLLIHLGVYICAVIAAYIKYNNQEAKINMYIEHSWNSWHMVFVVILGVLTSLITFTTSMCMLQKKPKDIMSIAKSMEG